MASQQELRRRTAEEVRRRRPISQEYEIQSYQPSAEDIAAQQEYERQLAEYEKQEAEFNQALSSVKAERDLAIQNRDKIRADIERLRASPDAKTQGIKDTIKSMSNSSNEQNHAAERLTQVINRMESEKVIFKPSDIQEYVQGDIKQMQIQEQVIRRAREGKPMYAVV